jgi:hypothetical protein
MRVEVTAEVRRNVIDAAWKLYREAFDELRLTAVQRHLMFRTEFDDVMRDTRIRKYVCYDDPGEMTGLSTFTNDLDAMPLISPDYFQHRWPIRFAEKRIWYVGFVAVHPAHRGTGAFEGLVEAMYHTIAGQHAVVGLDMCRRNEDHGLPDAIQAVLVRLATGVRHQRIDEQSYWLYEFPAA